MFLPRHLIRILLASASFCAAAPALAQQQSPQPSPQAPATNATDQTEIVVTATRQEQVLSRVPISISAYNQEAMDIKGAKTLDDIARFTPGLTFDDTSNAVAVRGISSTAGAGTTGIYIDDTPIQIRSLGFDSDNTLPAIFDLDRIEVLRGPQGTLFGAGSEGGTVRYITPQPSLDKWSVYARTEVSATEHGGMSYEGGVAIGGPIIEDRLGFRISSYYRHDSGWIDKADDNGIVYNKNTNYSNVAVFHAALTWKPTDRFTITPSFHYQNRLTADDARYTEGLSDPGAGVFRDSTPEYRRDPDNFILPSLKMEYDFGWAKLISNTSYFSRNDISGYDGTTYDLSYFQTLPCAPGSPPGTPPCNTFLSATGEVPGVATLVNGKPYISPSVITNRQRILTQEVRLQSNNPNAPITWVIGGFYQWQKQLSREELVDPYGNALFEKYFGMSQENWFTLDAGLDPSDPTQLLQLYNGVDSYINQSTAYEKQFAGFADVTWHITSKLSVNAGGRVAHYDYRFTNFADGPQQYGRAEASGNTRETPFTPKGNVTWQINPDHMIYATYARGFRPGGANASIPPNACDELPAGRASSPYKSDRVDSFEIGTKDKFFNRKLSVSASIYTINWKGIQNFVELPSCEIQFIDNIGNARSRGFDLQINATPFKGLSIDAAIGYTDAHYTTTAINQAVYEETGTVLASAGDAIPGIAPWTISIGAQYSFKVSDQATAYFRGDYQFESKLTRQTPTYDPESISYAPWLAQPSATFYTSVRAGIEAQNGLNVSVFIDNLFNTTPMLSDFNDNQSLFFTPETWRPRTMGMTVTYRM